MRLIDADALKKKAFSDPDTTMSGEALVYVQDIDDTPTIEAEPVKHGRWVTGSELTINRKNIVTPFLYCSVCGEEAYWDTGYGQQKFNYCPNCGAKMDGGDNDATD